MTINIPEDTLKYSSSLVTYEDCFQRIYEYLQNKEGVRNVLATSVITTLMSIISSISAGLSSGILTAEQEAFLQTANNRENVLAKCALDFGLFLSRKNPAQISVQIQNSSVNPVVIPKFSSFTVDKIKLFNRDKLIIPAASVINVTLYEGEKMEESFTVTGAYDTFFLSKTNNFNISTEDIYAQDLKTEEIYTCIQEPLFTTGSNAEPAVQQVTLPDGSVMIKLGNDIYGKLPSTGSTLKIYYIKTNGKSGNESLKENTKIIYAANTDLIILSKSSLILGEDELSTEYYRNFAPGMKSSLVIGGAVTLDQLKPLALSFRDVIDCQLLGQRSTFPTDLRYLNVVQASVLTSNGLLPDTDWDEFVSHMRQRTTFEFSKVDPTSVDINLTLEVFVSEELRSADTVTKIKSAFAEYFTPRLNYIGMSFYLSDVGKILRTVLGSEELQRYNVIFPKENRTIQKTQYLVLRNITVTLKSDI